MNVLELEHAENDKKNMERQWNDMLTAMSKRDQAMQAIHDARESLQYHSSKKVSN